MDKDLYDLSDEELEAAFEEVKAAQDFSDVNEVTEDVSDDVDVEDEDIEPETEEETEEEYDESLEQPEDDQDSDSDDSTEDEEDDESDEDAEETDEDDPDEESEEDEAEPTEEETETKDEVQPVQKRKFKANGREYELSDEEILKQFPQVFGQAMDYTRKMQKIKPYRQMIDAWEQENLTQEDLNLAIDVLKGNKEAISTVLKRTGVDTIDLDPAEEQNYVPKSYGRDEVTLNISEVVDKISSEPEYETTRRILSKEWDDASWSEFQKDPSKIEALHTDVKSGVYQQVQPIADIMKVQDGGRMSDLDYYIAAAQKYFANAENERVMQSKEAERQTQLAAEKAEKERITQVKAERAKVNKVKANKAKRKAATTSKKVVKSTKPVDYLDDSDEAFEEWYNKLQDSM